MRRDIFQYIKVIPPLISSQDLTPKECCSWPQAPSYFQVWPVHWFVLGILLDSYFSATPEISYHIEDNDYKISQTVQVKEMSYGILIRAGTNLSDWLELELQEIAQDTISNLIADEIGSEVQKLF